MPNERLRQALTDAELEVDDLANQADVDIRTAQRWLAGRTPHPRQRRKVGRILNVPADELWPDATATCHPTGVAAAAPDQPPNGDATEDRAADEPARRSRSDCETAFQSSRQIDLLDYTLAPILRAPQNIDTLITKAANGCQIRILVAAPNYHGLDDADAELHPDLAETLGTILDGYQATGRMQPISRTREEALLAREQLWQLEGHAGIEIRQYRAHRYNTILRYDNHMNAGLNLYGVQTADAPELHIHPGRGDHLFERFLAHYESIWQRASPLTDPIDTTQHPAHRPLVHESAAIDYDSYRYAIRQAKDNLRQQIGRAYAEYTAQFDKLNRRLNSS